MDRLTMFDKARSVYVIAPDVKQGQNIQRLGMYEDRDTAQLVKFYGDTREECNAECPACGGLLIDGHIGLPENYNFCPTCGQRIKWRADEC